MSRRRRELKDWPGFKMGLWAEEHSAQLSPQENARLQDLFRMGMRNILSSTTTLELGIDIGGLSAVLMGNLPPGKANYLQRAGRAGRRADGTSAVLGFARPAAYEREVFLNFRNYLGRDLRSPTIFLDRAPLVKRHAQAWLLNEFMKEFSRRPEQTGAMEAFGKMGEFCGISPPDYWAENQKPSIPGENPNATAEQFLTWLGEIQDQPRDSLKAALSVLWAGCPTVSPQPWQENLIRFANAFRQGLDDWKASVRGLMQAWEEVPATASRNDSLGRCRAQANSIRYQIKTLCEITVIESLADARVLPRYGFPVGQSRLKVQAVVTAGQEGRVREEDQFRLQRDSMMSLREYAPGSKLLVGGKVVTSRGILKHWTGSQVTDSTMGMRGKYATTDQGWFDYHYTDEDLNIPDGQTGHMNTFRFLIPKHGFSTAAWDPPEFGAESSPKGQLSMHTLAFKKPEDCDRPQLNFGGLQGCEATYRDAGELFLVNSGEGNEGFAICQRCGYAEAETKSGGQGRVNLNKEFEWHAPLNSPDERRTCWNKEDAPIWRHYRLVAKQATNLLKLDFNGFGQPLNRKILYTIGQALRLAGAKLLELDEREIGLLDISMNPSSRDWREIILFETLAGGSGHLAELCHPDKPDVTKSWLKSTVDLLTVPGDSPDPTKKREARRRLLTPGCRDEWFVPLDAAALLSAFMNGAQTPHLTQTNEAKDHADLWTLERLAKHGAPDEFQMWLGPNAVRGLVEGAHNFCRWESPKAKPEIKEVVIVKFPDLSIRLGEWHYRLQTGNKPHRVHLRGPNPHKGDYTEAEYSNLEIIARLRRS